MRQQLTYVIGIVVVSIAGIVYTIASGNEPLLGLDRINRLVIPDMKKLEL